MAERLAAGAQGRASSTSSGPTARPRCRSSTKTACPKRLDERAHLHPARSRREHRGRHPARAHRARDPAVAAASSSPTTTFEIFVNPTGLFELGGPHADCGLTGRKIIVDTYGGMARHGGGAFSGKDPTKVDRSAAYAVRQIAKSIVAAGLAKRCEAQVAYAIGVAHPMSIMVDTFGTGEIADEKLEAIVREVFDMRPAAIIERLDLRRPIFKRTAAYGHFGRTDGRRLHVGEHRALRRTAAARRRRLNTQQAQHVMIRGPGLPGRARRRRGRARLRLLGSRRARRPGARRRDRARRAARPAGARVGRRRRRRLGGRRRRRCSRLLAVTSAGPPEAVVALTEWAAYRYCGSRVALLRSASPPNLVRAGRAAAPTRRSGAARRVARRRRHRPEREALTLAAGGERRAVHDCCGGRRCSTGACSSRSCSRTTVRASSSSPTRRAGHSLVRLAQSLGHARGAHALRPVGGRTHARVGHRGGRPRRRGRWAHRGVRSRARPAGRDRRRRFRRRRCRRNARPRGTRARSSSQRARRAGARFVGRIGGTECGGRGARRCRFTRRRAR